MGAKTIVGPHPKRKFGGPVPLVSTGSGPHGTFVLNVPPNRNFEDAIAVQDLRGIQYEIDFDVPPRTKILEPPLYTVQYIPGT